MEKIRRLSKLAHPALLIVVLALVYTFTVGRNPQGGPSGEDAALVVSLDLPQPGFGQLYVPIERSVAPGAVEGDDPVQVGDPGATTETVVTVDDAPDKLQEADLAAAADARGQAQQSAAVLQAVSGAASRETPAPADIAPEPAKKKPEIYEHTIRAGETLSDIAKAYGVDIDTILAANAIADPNRIRVGETLSIPNVKGVIHTVQRGESLWQIANYYEVSMDAILDANDIENPNRLQIGQKLVVPGAQALEALRRREAIVSPSGQLLRNFSWPTTGRISSRFGERWGRMHYGLDIAVPTGTPIRAAAAGTVTYAGSMGTYGILVMIDHGHGVETRYAHLSRVAVRVGQRVARGDIIAYSGNTGNSTGPHLHFEIRRNGVALDPLDFLR